MKRRHGIDQTDSELIQGVGVGQALREPGVPREAVFGREPKTNVCAYWINPTDVTRIVRVSADGIKTVGRITRGSFRAIRSK
jgi:hypothetical protein